MSVSYSLWYNVFKKHCHTKAFEVQNDPTRSASLINLFELGRIVQIVRRLEVVHSIVPAEFLKPPDSKASLMLRSVWPDKYIS